MKFSFCLIAKNEAKTVIRLIRSLTPFLDAGGEIILLDTGSTDATVVAAQYAGVKVTEVGDTYNHTLYADLVNKINAKFCVNEPPIVKVGDTYFDFASARNHAASLPTNHMVSFV